MNGNGEDALMGGSVKSEHRALNLSAKSNRADQPLIGGGIWLNHIEMPTRTRGYADLIEGVTDSN